MRQSKTRIARLRSRVMVLPAFAVFAMAGCDTSVTNPGPVQDVFLDSLNAHAAIVNGASRNLSDALDRIAYWVGALTYEINPAGSTGSFGIPVWIQDGRYDIDATGDWNRISLARFTAEDALRRFAEVLPNIPGAPAFSSYGLAARATLLAGYANRTFGENFCQVVYDGGSLQPFSDALIRAEAHFTDAMSIAGASGDADIVTAAQAGRASIRAGLATYGMASWSDAASDAAAVTSNAYTYEAGYSDQDQAQGNYIMIAAPGLGTYRAATVWGTYYEDYFRQTPADTRTPWAIDAAQPFGDAGVTKFGGNVNFFPQDKYPVPETGINLSSGWEMRLIEAEAQLNGGSVAAAVGFMNQRRTDLGLTAIPVGTAAAAYTALKGERALELWLEGRRMFDLNRWDANGISGGITDVLDGIYGTSTAAVAGVGQSTAVGVLDTQLTTLAANVRCWPVGNSEYETNTNVNR